MQLSLDTLVDTSTAPVFGMDSQGKCDQWSSMAAQKLGFSRAEVIGCDFFTKLAAPGEETVIAAIHLLRYS